MRTKEHAGNRLAQPASVDQTVPASKQTGDQSMSLPNGNEGRPYWQTRSCPAWCGNVHLDDHAVADRRCFSDWSAEVVLTTEDPVRTDLGPNHGGVSYDPVVAEVSLARRFREFEPRVVVEEQHRGFEFGLTLDEAERFGEALLSAVTLARVPSGIDLPVEGVAL